MTQPSRHMLEELRGAATTPPEPFDCTSSTSPHSSNIFIALLISSESRRFVASCFLILIKNDGFAVDIHRRAL